MESNLFLLLLSFPTLLFTTPAFAQCNPSGWCKVGCWENQCAYVKVISRNYPYVIFNDQSKAGLLKQEADCRKYRMRFIYPDGSKSKWRDVKPGTFGETTLETVCNM